MKKGTQETPLSRMPDSMIGQSRPIDSIIIPLKREIVNYLHTSFRETFSCCKLISVIYELEHIARNLRDRAFTGEFYALDIPKAIFPLFQRLFFCDYSVIMSATVLLTKILVCEVITAIFVQPGLYIPMGSTFGYGRQRIIAEGKRDEVEHIIAGCHLTDTAVITPLCFSPFFHMGKYNLVIVFSVGVDHVIRMPEQICEDGIQPFEAFSFGRIGRVRIFIAELFHQILDTNLMRCQCVE